jgi:hypothetical protein
MTMGQVENFSKRGSAWGLVFSWRVRRAPFFPKLVALAVAGVVFFFLLTAVRIKVVAPERGSQKKASVILLSDDAVGRVLRLRAEEGGPFPSRFELGEWVCLGELEEQALANARFSAPIYQPMLGELQFESEIPPVRLAARGEAVFPQRAPVVLPQREVRVVIPQPQLFPLAGISWDELPKVQAPIQGTVDAAMSASTWRFLVRLNREGGVTECVSLENAGDAGAQLLEDWLKQLQFNADPSGASARWISLGIQLINQTADGSDAD